MGNAAIHRSGFQRSSGIPHDLGAQPHVNRRSIRELIARPNAKADDTTRNPRCATDEDRRPVAAILPLLCPRGNARPPVVRLAGP